MLAATESRPAGLVGEAIGELRSGLIVAIVTGELLGPITPARWRWLGRRYDASSAELRRAALELCDLGLFDRRELANAGVRAGLLAPVRNTCLPRAQPAARSRGDRFLHGRTPACGSETVRAGSAAPLRGRRPGAVAGARVDLCRQTSVDRTTPAHPRSSHRRRVPTRSDRPRSPEPISRGNVGSASSSPARRGVGDRTGSRLPYCGVARRGGNGRDPRPATRSTHPTPQRPRSTCSNPGPGAGLPTSPATHEGGRLPRSAQRLGRDSRRSRPPAASRGRSGGHVRVDLRDRHRGVVERPSPDPAVGAAPRAAATSGPSCWATSSWVSSRPSEPTLTTCAWETAWCREPECRAVHAAGAGRGGQTCAGATTRSACTLTAAWRSSSERPPTSARGVPDGCDDLSAAVAQPLAVALHALTRGAAASGRGARRDRRRGHRQPRHRRRSPARHVPGGRRGRERWSPRGGASTRRRCPHRRTLGSSGSGDPSSNRRGRSGRGRRSIRAQPARPRTQWLQPVEEDAR